MAKPLKPTRTDRGFKSPPEAEVEAALAEIEAEAVEHFRASFRARIERVAAEIPVGDEQEILVEARPGPPYFGVTTRRVGQGGGHA